MRVELLADEIVKITHLLTNVSGGTLNISPWVLSVMAPGGVALIPQPPLDLHPTEFPEGREIKAEDLPNRDLVLWPFTDLTDGRYAFSKNFLRVTYLPERPATKLGMKLRRAGSRTTTAGTFLRSISRMTRRSHIRIAGATLRFSPMWRSSRLESLAPSAPLAPGAVATHLEHRVCEISRSARREGGEGVFRGVAENLTLESWPFPQNFMNILHEAQEFARRFNEDEAAWPSYEQKLELAAFARFAPRPCRRKFSMTSTGRRRCGNVAWCVPSDFSSHKMMKPKKPIESLILNIRNQKVILDADLAELYGVPTKVLNQAVKRNADRFPQDFLFQLTAREWSNLRSRSVTSSLEDALSKENVAFNRSQFVTSSKRHRGGDYRPWAFTEHGAIMAATVLNSSEAVAMSIFVVRAFLQMREQLAANAAILKRLAEIDKTLLGHDTALRAIWAKLQPLLEPPPEPPPRRIKGFNPHDK